MSVELELRSVRAGYGSVEVVHGVSLDVPAGVLTALLGPNGAGKSTLLSVIAGLVPIRSGEVRWAGTVINGVPVHRRAADGMMLIPEGRGIFPSLSVRDNLEVFAGTGTDVTPATDAFPVLGSRMQQTAGQLSGGEQQMLAMSRALLQTPRVLLLDELSTGLAPRVTREIFTVIEELARHGTTVVLVEQHLSDALRMAEVVYILSRGEVVFAGEPSELRTGVLPGYVLADASTSPRTRP
jgi:branched-chain amino acid transport system ATP-binding protein